MTTVLNLQEELENMKCPKIAGLMRENRWTAGELAELSKLVRKAYLGSKVDDIVRIVMHNKSKEDSL